MANRYWVGGAASWDTTAGTKWATTSGGAGGASVPTSADAVFFDASSGAGSVLISGAASCQSMDTTGFTGTLALSASSLSVYGNFKLVSGMTFTASGGTIYLLSGAAGGTYSCDFAGKSFNGKIELGGGQSGTWNLQSNLALTGSGMSNLFTVNGGSTTFNTNGFTVTAGQFSCNGGGGTATLNLGTSTINAISFTATAGNTLAAGTSTIKLYAGAGLSTSTSFNGGGKSYNVVTMANDNDAVGYIWGSNTFANLTLQNSSGSTTNYFVLESGTTQTITGTLTIAGNNAGSRRLMLMNNSKLAQSTLNPTGTRSISNTDFRGIAVSGTALSGTSIGDAGNNSGITFTTATTRYAVAAGAFSSTSTWSAASGGAAGASVPLPQDTIVLDASTPAGTYTWDLQCIGQLNATPTAARTLSLTTPQGIVVLTRGATINSNVTLTGAFTNALMWWPAVASTMSVTPASGRLKHLNVGGPATATLGADLTLAGTLQVDLGTFTANGYNVTAATFGCQTLSTDCTINMGSGTWTAASTSPITFPYSGPTLNANTSTLVLQSGGTVTLGLTARTFNNITIQGSNATSFADSTNVTGNVLSHTDSGDITFCSGASYTFSTWSISGAPGAVRTLSPSSTTNYTLVKSGGGTVTLEYLSLSRSTASPASTFTAYSSTDGGNNTNWTIYAGDPRKGGNLFFGSNF